MANPFRQMAQQRKLIYSVLILGLFTVSLLQRKLLIEPEAFNLQLRELARGEVELTSSAVRLTLTGSRGLAVTVLWWEAMKKQEKHDWNEFDLIVSSITKLQPYFITPWVFQSWNLAFNVAVECDRPVDKYYYVSRGMELLAEGERRNQGSESVSARTRFPGHPDMRQHMATTYQLKIGSSDEKYTMRSLLELSCIDPAKRDPDLFLRGNQVDLDELRNFCKNYPRLVRRLREHLGYEAEKQIVDFLGDIRDIPSRFEKRGGKDQTQTPLKKPRDQFPCLPLVPEEDWPRPETPELTNEAIDVYLIARTWFQYAQKPLPAPAKQMRFLRFNSQEHRLPRQMALILFRGQPARAQAFIAETLQEEGWFDGEGWTVPGWFDQDRSTSVAESVVVGREPKYLAGSAWARAHDMFVSYGADNGLYLSDSERRDLEAQATPFREKYNLAPDDPVKDLRIDPKDKGFLAHQGLRETDQNLAMANYNAFLYQTEAERTPEAVLARKLYYFADKFRRQSPGRALEKFEQATPLWLDVLLQFPRFAQVGSNQEDTYEMDLKFMRLKQREEPAFFQKVTTGMWQAFASPFTPLAGALAVVKNPEAKKVLVQWPFVPWLQLLSEGDRNKITPVRSMRGIFEMTQFYDGPNASELKDALLLWTQGASMGPRIIFPGQKNMLLTRAPIATLYVPPGWRNVVSPEAVQIVRDRLGLKR